MTQKNKIIIMMSGPGAGKGTYSQMLMERDKYKYIGIGDILRSMPPESDISKIISSGNLVPDKLVCDLVEKNINSDIGVILDGFPRNLAQAKWLVKKYADNYDVRVIFLSVSTETMVARILKRFKSGSKRHDDVKPDIINHRIENFFKTTMPAIDWLRTESNITFDKIDANGDIQSVFADIISALGK